MVNQRKRSLGSEQLQAPIILRESSDNDVPLGSRKVFTCNAIGYPPPTYMWLLEWQNLTSNFSSLSYFEIPSTKKQDQGSYRCLAKNDVGIVASKAAHLTVWYFDGLINNQRDQFINVYESDAVILHLPIISSSPDPTVQWFMKSSSSSRDNIRIIINEKYFITSTHNLVILNTEYHDEKIYFAIIENIFVGGTKQSSDFRLQINRRKIPLSETIPEFIIKPTDQLATIGDAIKSFECVANAGPGNAIEIIWQKNAILIDQTTGRFHIGPYNRTLEVRGITADDQGIYSCHIRIKNSDNFINASAKLIVRGVPIISTNFPLIQNVDLQENIVFTCDGTPISTNFNVTWYKNAILLTNESSKIQLIDNKLIINTIEWNDQGMYQCFLTNDVGEDTRSTWLKIKSEPPTVTASKDLIVFNGTDVELTCTVNGSPFPNITWFKLNSNDNQRILINNLHGRFHIDNRTGVLSITNTLRDDSGIFECLAQNILGSAHARTTLLVHRRTRIISLPQTMKIVKAQSLVLVCQVFSEDDIAKRIHWYFNYNQIIPHNRFYNESTILIDTPQNQDTGNYTCIVESEAGNDSRTTEVTIIELPWPPTFVRASLMNDSLSKSVIVNLTWIPNFDGNIPIERYTIQMKDSILSDINGYDDIGWQNKEDIVIQKNQTKTWTLIHHLRPFTTYRFRLSAWNQLGEGQISSPSNNVTLPEEIPNGTVKSLTAVPRDSTSVLIEYTKPIESGINGQLIGYNINYALNYPNLNWKSIRVNSSIQSYILKDLMTWESYLITVAVVNNVGIGPASEIVKVRTLEGIPSRAPIIIQYEPINSTAIMIKWQGPLSSYINGILNSFKIELIDLNRNLTLYQEQQAKPIEMYQLSIGYLKKYTNYSVRINCATKIGSGPWSSPIVYIQTLEDVPDQVENLTFSNVYDTSMDISWQKPLEINGDLNGYELEWYQMNNTQLNLSDRLVVEIKPDLTTYKINNLSATTWYTISVRAKTRKGFGLKRSASIESGYPPEMPSPPTNLEVISIEKRSAIIKFTPGYTGKTNILRYIIEIQMKSNNSQWENLESFNIEQSTLTLHDLHPYQLYRIRMSAVNIKGISNTSIPTEFFRTKPDVPSSVPQMLLAQAINSSAIRVRWMPIPTNEWNSISSTGKDIGYIISINDSKTDDIKIEDPLITEYIFTNLLPANTPFLIRLSTFNSIGKSSISIETIEKTFESVPLHAPLNVRIDLINGTSAIIHWNSLKSIDQGGLITNYKIIYFPILSSQFNYTIDYSDNSSSMSYILNNLDGYTNYSCSISACTSSGCSTLSKPIMFMTDENVPSKPTEVFFPNVDHWSAKMIWQQPTKLNGILIGYKLVYWRSDDEQTRIEINNLTNITNSYLAENLEKTTPYTFILCAKTRMGCGETSINRLLTMEKRDRPAAPYPPTIIETSINSTSLILTWRKDSDFNYAPIRYTLIEYEQENTLTWKPYDPSNKPDGQITSLIIQNLKPNTKYRFRLASQNDMGISDYSRSTNYIRTKQNVPNIQPTIDYISTDHPCQLDIYFKNFDSIENTTRLKVLIKSITNDQLSQKSFHSINQDNSIHLKNLCKDYSYMNDTYVLYVCLSNSIGDGPLSFAHYFHIQLPAPIDLTITSVNLSVLSSTEILMKWNLTRIVPSIGYRIRWIAANETNKEKNYITSYNDTSVVLNDLNPFTVYKIMINVFNINGDGPIYETDLIRTDEDAPGSIDQLTFSYVTFTSLQLDWQLPKSLNGILRSYDLTYDNRLSFSSSTNTSSTRVKTIKQLLSPNNTSLRIDELEPYQFYEFTLCACTIKCGPCLYKSIQTGPQVNSPLSPYDLFLNKHNELTWKSSIISDYYLIEFSNDYGKTWKFLDRISKSPYYLNSNIFQPNQSMEYYFRIYSINHIGISEASQIYKYNLTLSSSSTFLHPFKIFSNIQLFLRSNQLFLYIILSLLALLILMFICIIITCCCCRMKLNKRKLLQSTNTLSSNLNNAESKQSLYTASTLLTPINRELTLQRNRDSLALSDLLYNNFSSRSPPRPIPTPIVYDDLTSTKSLLNNQNYSSEENQSTTDYPWYHSLPQQLYTYMSNNHLTTNKINEENENDETDLTVAFNGAILMNNVPRSRAAVNGCSSFAL
ncbi:unnamed protein product [Adineta steineri]|uniref:Uncharacterized protein n=2 Tax=Adineta steineri TaxID=433720 RepID=A0A819BHT0_9BILA|nr:unnamed protein product [Adineta steineri]